MDALSHALVGVAVAGISGHTPNINDPLYIAAVLGSQAPDADIVALVRGNLTYLKQHRAFSHSLIGVVIWSAFIAFGMSFFFSAMLEQVFLWALLGGLSHVCLDYFNTHGVAIFWPFFRERKSFPLLNVFDPVLFLLTLCPYLLHVTALRTSQVVLALVAGYIVIRGLLRWKAVSYLKKSNFNGEAVISLWVMPSLKHFYLWDFVVETRQAHLNGHLGIVAPLMEIVVNLPRQQFSQLAAEVQQTTLGKFFSAFTPYPYFEEEQHHDHTKVYIYDLRYYGNEGFLHSAQLVFNNDKTLRESSIHSLGRTIEVTG